ncbi:hypothetical protein Taro_017202, partial [Colocasia esculenta]|nr:hypothetical protein [Colocasia esculenta]
MLYPFPAQTQVQTLRTRWPDRPCSEVSRTMTLHTSMGDDQSDERPG